jgi:dihydrolipoamide dehydrogenase
MKIVEVLLINKKKTKNFTMKYDIIVLGSGPGGYVTVIRASQLGFSSRNRKRGGVCLNWDVSQQKPYLNRLKF